MLKQVLARTHWIAKVYFSVQAFHTATAKGFKTMFKVQFFMPKKKNLIINSDESHSAFNTFKQPKWDLTWHDHKYIQSREAKYFQDICKIFTFVK